MIPYIETVNRVDVNRWCDLANSYFGWQNPEPAPPSGLVFAHLNSIPAFLHHHANNGRQYVLVSGQYDGGIALQEDNHPNAELARYMQGYDWNCVAEERSVYVDIHTRVPVSNFCKASDRYMIRTASLGIIDGTFPEVPDNILQWYSCNLAVDHPRMQLLPFGCANDLPEEFNRSLYDTPKEKLLFVCFTDTTPERKTLNDFYCRQPWVSWFEPNRPHEEYLREMARHKFVLAPRGVGWDTYRFYEALYCGCIPVIEDGQFADKLPLLPVYYAEDFLKLTPEDLERFYRDEILQVLETNYVWLTKSFWVKRFNEWRAKLGVAPKDI